MLLGVTMTEDEQRLFGGVLPLDDVESGAIDLAGRFAELVDRLQAALDALDEPQADRRLGGGDRRRRRRADRDDAARRLAARRAAAPPRRRRRRGRGGRRRRDARRSPEVRALLADRLQGRPTRANFRTGHLTICTLVPMRSVPHRVVCLLGLDDGVFPRKAPRDGDDLMLDDPHVGDRDARTEDRQLLLDALLAATDRLIVTYTGNDERTNSPRPPAVPVGELLDVVDRTVRTRRPRARARRRAHPLQPFDPRNFTAGALVRERPWSFDRVDARRARARSTGARAAPRPFLAGPLPGRSTRRWSSSRTSCASSQHPVRAFLRQRLGISVGDYADEVEDALPVELDGLERGASASGCSTRGSPAPTVDGGDRRRDRARHAAAGRARPSP